MSEALNEPTTPYAALQPMLMKRNDSTVVFLRLISQRSTAYLAKDRLGTRRLRQV